MKQTDLSALTRQTTESFLEAQKRLMDVAGQDMNASVETAGKTLELLKPYPFLPVSELTREAVKSYVDAQKALMDVVVKAPNAAAKLRRRKAVKTVKRRRRQRLASPEDSTAIRALPGASYGVSIKLNASFGGTSALAEGRYFGMDLCANICQGEGNMGTITATPAAKISGGSFLIDEGLPDNVFTPEDFTEQHQLIAQTAEEFATNEIFPNIDRMEHKEFAVTRELLKKAGDLGLSGVDVPEAVRRHANGQGNVGDYRRPHCRNTAASAPPGVRIPASARCPLSISAPKSKRRNICPAGERPDGGSLCAVGIVFGV